MISQVEWYNKGDLDFSEVTTVNLDEYKGLPRTNDQSYYYFMHQHLFDRVNIDPNGQMFRTEWSRMRRKNAEDMKN